MLYIYVIALVLITLIVIYTVTGSNKKDEYNIMEDVPVISINKEGLERHAMEIAHHYSSTRSTNSRRQLITSLDKSYNEILKGYEYIDKDVRNKKEIVPAAEWMLDNLYLIEKEYKDIKHNMPVSYYKGLPVIDKGIMRGYPRVYYIAVEMVSHTDGRIDEQTIESFIKAYQKNTVLTSGELWALPIMIRIALIQNISKIVKSVIYAQQEKKRGDASAERIINAFNDNKMEIELKRLYESSNVLSSYFIERLLKVLRDNGIDNPEVYKWIDEKLEIQQTNSEKMIILEHQKQAGFQLSMGNCVNSIRAVEALNWRDTFERLSFVEEILKKDPAKIYTNMDFESRDYYRHKLEKLSKHINMAESFVAKKAIDCAKKAEISEDKPCINHVGYYLIDDGIETLKASLGFKERGFNGLVTMAKKYRVGFYTGGIEILTLLLSILMLGVNILSQGYYENWRYIVAFIVLLIPCSEIINSIFNWSINQLSDPRFVPKLEFKDGIPEDSSSIVVIPTLINSEKRVEELISEMEVYYLANHEKNLYFALLGDFVDSDREHLEDDEKIVDVALKLIKKLNKKYSEGKEDIFYFLNRYRQFNEKQGLWLGWERKRGKIMEFNSLLRGEKNTSYNVVSGDISNLQKIKYVITIDADTELPRDSAKKLIGAMSHILNKPILSKFKKSVLRGYGLMQPRIGVGTLAANKTLFSKIFSGETGIDMYTTAISDVYQDLFGEGIFTGKGIYDIDVFEYMLKDEIPENSVLSHDLLEGSYVRAALVTDLELIDGYPAYYNSSSVRLHRWIRGDWQLLPWLFKKSPLNRLSRWKIFDNLRRSLLVPSIIILIVSSLTILPGIDEWLLIAFLAVICPILFDVSEAVVSPVKGISLSGKIENGKMAVDQMFLIFCFLPYQGYLMVDAIIRTLYRLFISKRNLLEWMTAADAEVKLGRKLNNFITSMLPGSIIAVIISLLAFNNSASLGLFMLPSCILWFVSPAIAYYISKENKEAIAMMTKDDEETLRRLSRKTWAYFEDFVNEKNNYLAPDNFQEDPANGVAPRTSPTNMGMGLTSNLAAYDLGYIGLLEVVDRTDKVLTNMESLVMYKGHFYNWYDTTTKEPLYPRYVSTVDSGNLAGYLWVMSEAFEEYINKPLVSRTQALGLCDTLKLANDEINDLGKNKDFYISFIEELKTMDFNISSFKKALANLWSKAIEIEKTEGHGDLYWNNKVKSSVGKYLKEFQVFFPWLDMVIESSENDIAISKELKEMPLKVSIKELSKELNIHIEECKAAPSMIGRNQCEELQELLFSSASEINRVLEKVLSLKERLNKMVDETDFRMLYDKKRQLFSIGYEVEKDSLGNSYYDLLASECRQASFVAIAKGDIDQKHWFKLGRAMTIMDRSKGLVSWSGTMFEYFMPLLIMKNYPDTLLNETYKSVIKGQKKYGRDRKVPWGLSESAFYTFDVALNYQYKAFGVPGIGLKRGLVNELVIAPYSTVMALQIDLQGSLKNIYRLIDEGLEGRYGFYDAIDYTKDRMPKGKNKALVKCFMVHHEGMSFMALDNVLNNNILQERFHNIPKVKATELLLQERVPKRIVYDREQKFEVVDLTSEKQNIIVRNYNTAKTDMPETHLLSNGTYSLMISNSGSGYSKKGDMTVYRWREDVTQDNSGMFFYIKNMNSNEYWSATYEPCKYEGEKYEVIFSLDKAEFTRKDGNLTTHTELTVSNEDNAEVRRISISNHSEHTRTVEITSYCEVTLAPYNADIVHPTFSNLFIKTEYLDNLGCVLANRRPRAKGQKKPYMMQVVSVEGETVGTVQYETSRLNFVGRNRDIQKPIVMDEDVPLKNTIGAVLDPIISIRRRVKIRPGQTCKIAYTTAVANSKEEVIELARKYREMQNVNRTFELAWTQSQMEMKYMGIKSTQANLYQLMASKIIFINNMMKERAEYIRNIRKSQPALWPYGVSGDIPIVLVIVREERDVDLVRQVLNAHEYWSIKGLKVDLVVINLQNTLYVQPLQDSIRDLISSSHARDKQNKQGGVFIHSKATMAEDDINLLFGIARLIIDSDKGSLLNQIKITKAEDEVELLEVEDKSYNYEPYKFAINDLEYFNGYGGFDLKNNTYTIRLKDNKNTPAPWINVISNKDFGFHVSESGSSYTWYKNSRENKVTTWSNDPITDPISEALYLRDEINGRVWSITPKPIRDSGEYIIEHGFGYSNFKHEAHGIIGEMTMFVPKDKSVKFSVVKLKNNCKEERRLSLTYYAQLVLGVVPQQTAQYISTYLNEDKGYIYAQNPYSQHFGKAYTYLKIVGGNDESFSGSRKEFIGRGESLNKPEALKKKKLSNTVGSGFDPCLSTNTKITLKSKEEVTLIVIFGENESLEDINTIVENCSNTKNVYKELEGATDFWKRLLGTIKVKTPDKTMDIMLNGWLMYQTLACRVWSRTAFYQSGGALGFRDQLQDVMAIGYLDSSFTKNQILESASRQFVEGDVQHWWHPVVNSGIRTRFSDDLLWLPYVTIDYIKNTGDYGILDEEVSYLQDEPLKEGEDERYNVVQEAAIKGTIYEHCIKTIERGLKFGSHNIPLMGSGDWNDGMSTIGNKGKGESVWVGWFLYSILDNFKEFCKFKGDEEKFKRYEEFKEFIRENLEANAWDGNWYRRAYFDDGTPLGSIENDECQIDAIAQSWAVISGAAKQSRAEIAMKSVEKYLIKDDSAMVLLLTPPFNKSTLEPGYIKGYVPGVRENGGQYTHASTWVILALAKLGYGSKAWKTYNMINPINHAKSELECEIYKVEPYVMTADVYVKEPHEGRGGWSWYTGASGWMYRVGIEGILGLKIKEGKGFTVEPTVPEEWNSYEMTYTKDNCKYNIVIRRGDNKCILLDGTPVENNIVPFLKDGEYKVEVVI